MKVLITSAAGFIGMHVAKIQLERGDEVEGVDSLNDYCGPRLKLARLEQLKPFANFRFVLADIATLLPWRGFSQPSISTAWPSSLPGSGRDFQ